MKTLQLLSMLILTAGAFGQVGITDRISRAWPMAPNGDSSRIVASSGGHYIVYESEADNIVMGDTNGARDIFLYDWRLRTTEIISISGSGVLANGDSFRPDVASNGRFVVFQSAATNLVPGDTNGVSDIFVRDRQSETTFRVSVSTGGVQGNALSSICAISSNGAFVTFTSSATNLVAGDTNGVADAFLYDLNTGATTRVSIANGGGQSNGSTTDVGINGPGTRLVFSSTATNLVAGDTNGARDVFMRDTQAPTTTLISRTSGGTIGNADSRSPSINYNGDRVAYRSSATNLVTGDTNGVDDVFLRRVDTSVTLRASVSSSGVQGNGASLGASVTGSDIVVFQSTATNLVTGDTNGHADIFRKNIVTGEVNLVSISQGGSQGNGPSTAPSASTDLDVFISSATNLIFVGDTNGFYDGFARFLQAPAGPNTATRMATVRGLDADSGSHAWSISDNGKCVVFSSYASNIVLGDTNNSNDIFRLNLLTLQMSRVSSSESGGQSNYHSYNGSANADGNYVVFSSDANNLVAGDTNAATDIFLRDVLISYTKRVSVSSAGAQGNNVSGAPAISANSRFVAFQSFATNLVVGDTNAQSDVFIHDRQTSQTTRISVNSAGQQGNGFSGWPSISDDGNFVAFYSEATNLVPGDTNGLGDLFVRDRSAGTTARVNVSTAGVQGNGIMTPRCDISGDGSRVAFASAASNLVAGDTNEAMDVFLRDRNTNTTIRVSVTNAGAQGNNSSGEASISADGLSVGFDSIATNLVTGDTNGESDCFIRSLALNTTRRVSVSASGAEANGNSDRVFLSSDGLAATFDSRASNLVPLDRNGLRDVFLNDRRIRADLVTLVRGVNESGDPSSLSYPDDFRYVLRPGITFTTTQAPIELVVEGTGPVLNPSRLEFAIEFHSTAPAIRQTIEMYNFDTSAYELVDTRQSPITDAIAVVAITSNPDRFVSPTGLMRSRVSYKASGPVFAYPWRTRIDHVRWTQF